MAKNTLDIEELLVRGRVYYAKQDELNGTETSVTWNKHNGKFQVASIVHFQMPDGEGSVYWEEEVGGIDTYSPREFNIHLDTYDVEEN